MPKTVPFSMRLCAELKQRLQELANFDRRTLTNYVELLLEDHIAHGYRETAMKILKLMTVGAISPIFLKNSGVSLKFWS
jgi:hypothetical protein